MGERAGLNGGVRTAWVQGKGRERKGKERKGRERKGKEGKGRERKGKEGKGRERMGKEGKSKGKEGKGRERKGKKRFWVLRVSMFATSLPSFFSLFSFLFGSGTTGRV